MTTHDMVIESLVMSEQELKAALAAEREAHDTTREAYRVALGQMHQMTVTMRELTAKLRDLRTLLTLKQETK